MNLKQIVAELEKWKASLEQQLRQADAALSALDSLNHRPNSRNGRRTLSPAARRRIVAAQKARWAAWHKKHKKAV